MIKVRFSIVKCTGFNVFYNVIRMYNIFLHKKIRFQSRLVFPPTVTRRIHLYMKFKGSYSVVMMLAGQAVRCALQITADKRSYLVPTGLCLALIHRHLVLPKDVGVLRRDSLSIRWEPSYSFVSFDSTAVLYILYSFSCYRWESFHFSELLKILWSLYQFFFLLMIIIDTFH